MTDPLKDENLLDQLSTDAPQARMRSRFDRLLERPPRRALPAAAWAGLAAAAILVVVGFLSLTGPSTAPDDLRAQDADLLRLLEAPSTFERLRAIEAAAELPQLSPELGLALLERIESDPSLNVRLSAVGILSSRDLPKIVRDRLPSTLTLQETAIVQAHLGYRLVLQRILSKTDLERILERSEILPEARGVLTRLEES